MKQYLKNISFIKTIMMIVVVLGHSCIFFGGKWFEYAQPIYNAKYLYWFTKWLNTFHIQTFAMASGFLFYYLKFEKGKYNNPKDDIKKRVKRLLIPYLFACLLWVMPIAIYYFEYSFKDVIINFVLMKNPNQLWFLIMLFLVFVFFEVFSDKFKINAKNLILIYIFSTVIGLGLSYFDVYYFQISKAIQYVLYFYLGGYIYTNKNKITTKQTIIMFVMAIILYGTDLYLNHLGIKLIHYGTLLIEPIISVLEVSVIYYICTKLVDSNKINLNNKIYKVLEDNSFGIYLFHQQIIYFTIVLFNGLVHPIIQVLLSFIISLTISLIMSILLKKTKVTKFMFGL